VLARPGIRDLTGQIDWSDLGRRRDGIKDSVAENVVTLRELILTTLG